MRITVVCSSDPVWAGPTWDRTLPHLRTNGIDVALFVEVTGRPRAMRRMSYLRSFGPIAWLCLAAAAAVGLSKRALRQRPLTLRGICTRHGVAYARVDSANAPACRELLEERRPDALVAMTEYILKPEILRIPALGAVNKHAALLPAYKGMLPYFWARLEGAPQGVSYHLMTPEIDAGEVLLQRRCGGPETRSLMAFYRKVFLDYPGDLLEALRRLESGRYDGGSGLPPSYRGFPTAADYHTFRRAGGRLVGFRDILAGVPA